LTLQPEAHARFVRCGTIRKNERKKRRDQAG